MTSHHDTPTRLKDVRCQQLDILLREREWLLAMFAYHAKISPREAYNEMFRALYYDIEDGREG